MSWWEAALLGLVQGLTEFLPISSSGHLVLGKYVLGLNPAGAENVTFEVFVHFGTVLSILTVYWKDVLVIVQDMLQALIRPTRFKAAYAEKEGVRTGVYILLSMIPTGLAYVLFKDFFESAFAAPRLAAGMLIVTGILLLLTLLRRNPDGPLTPLKAVAVGAAQALAMIPGISRSGATICTAIYQNVEPERAANFSFLMLLPVVLGATLLKALELAESGLEAPWVILAIGTVVAYGSGVVAIRMLLGFVRRGRLSLFAYYCFAVGLLGVVFIP